ncbi:MAG: S1C family serine protease [Motilibacteraceae bacterium]
MSGTLHGAGDGDDRTSGAWWSTLGSEPAGPARQDPWAPPPAAPGGWGAGSTAGSSGSPTTVLSRPAEPASRRRGGRLLVAAALAAGLVGGGAGAGITLAATGGGGSTTTTTVASGSGGTANSNGTTTSTGSAPAPAADGSVQAAAQAILPSVVTIEVSGTQSGGFGGQQAVSDTGSGVVIRQDGYVLTNNHVVSAAENGGSVHATLDDGKTVSATIVGHDASSDLAVIKLDGVSGLKAATFADSDALSVGQTVIAVGAPLGLSGSVTDGIVSTLHRPVSTGEPGADAQSVLDAIQTDAAINPGNSGGPLVDLAGRVVGINSAIATVDQSSGQGSQSGNIGVGFAIPSNDAKKVADQLIADGKAVHAQMGVSVSDAPSSTTGSPGLGAQIRQVANGGPAAAAGLQPGDVVTKVDDRAITDADSLVVAVRSHDPGQTITVTYTRGGATRTAQVKLSTTG